MVLSPAIIGLGFTAVAHASDASRGVYRADDVATQPAPPAQEDASLDLWDLPPPPPPIVTAEDLLRTRASLEMVDIDLTLVGLQTGTDSLATPRLELRSDPVDFQATVSGDFRPFDKCIRAPEWHPRGRLEIVARLERGRFTTVTVTRDTTGEPRVASCLTDLVRAWELPEEWSQDVTYRFDLKR